MSQGSIADTYDEVYWSEQVKFQDIQVNQFPQGRNEALVWLAESGQRVLEIGCGGGNVLYTLRHRFTELHGVDLSPARIKKLEAEANRLSLSIHFSAGNIETGLDFPDGFFDVILWADVIEHVVDVWSAMREIHRLLADGGKLVTCTPNVAELRRRCTLLCGRFPSTSGSNEGLDVRSGELFDGGHLHYFTFSSLTNLYRRYGIRPTKTIGFGRLGYFHNLYPPLLSGSVGVVGVKQA